MPRRARATPGGYVYHILNRSVAGLPLFPKEADFETGTSCVPVSIPFRSEWESSCRGGLRTLFAFGNSLPDDREPGRWMDWNLSDPTKLPKNRLGSSGLFFGEWCADVFHFSYAPDAPMEPGSFVVRGGGAFFWPWQDDEWVWC